MNIPQKSPTFDLVFYRTYSRLNGINRKESWLEVCYRTIEAIAILGKFNPEQAQLVEKMQENMMTFPSGRWLWIGGTPWILKPENFPGAYNCTSTAIEDIKAIASLMNLAMMGCGTGAVLEDKFTAKLHPVHNKINLEILGNYGSVTPESDFYYDETILHETKDNEYLLIVGDSRQGWVDAYRSIIGLSIDYNLSHELDIKLDISSIRKSGTKLNGFGGVANPVKVKDMFINMVDILNNSIGRQLNNLELCLLIDHAATAVVAGNVRRSAGIRQGGVNDVNFVGAKMNLWSCGEDGKWRIDPKRDPLRMANHTVVFHTKPTLDDCIKAVQAQYECGEGAIQWAGEAVWRANNDITKFISKNYFMELYQKGELGTWMKELGKSEAEIKHRVNTYGLNPCGEIIGNNFFCNLSEIHLNKINPDDYEEQERAFRAGALNVCALLHHEFTDERYRQSREFDPIVGVSFTGLFDFFVNAFGIQWLNWFQAGRPNTEEGRKFKHQEIHFLTFWRGVVEREVKSYCESHRLKCPNRYTTVQPAGTKSLLTNACPGWHPPKYICYIRRITFRRDDPVALAAIDYGYNVIPSESDRDDVGNLLDDPLDPRVKNWLVEVPVAVSWANMDGIEHIDPSNFSAAAQFDFYMNVQQHYTTHNTSATIEVRENELLEVAHLIHKAIKSDAGYISATLLARFDVKETFPRLPFEPISKLEYDIRRNKISNYSDDDFLASVNYHMVNNVPIEHSPSGCDSDACLMPELS